MTHRVNAEEPRFGFTAIGMLVTLMSVALKPSRRKRGSSPSKPARSAPSPLGSGAGKRRASAVQSLPAHDQIPAWVRSLLLAQQASVIATFVLAGAVLVVYGWTVYAQHIWGKEYQRLETLRRNERQLTTNKEVLKDQIAKQGNRPGTSLVPQSPDSLIFLKPEPSRSTSSAAPSPAAQTLPLGY